MIKRPKEIGVKILPTKKVLVSIKKKRKEILQYTFLFLFLYKQELCDKRKGVKENI